MVRLKDRFAASKFWSDLGYAVVGREIESDNVSVLSTDTIYSDQDEACAAKSNEECNPVDSTQLCVDLRCTVFDSIVPGLALDIDIGYLRNLVVDFSMHTPLSKMYFHVLMENLQYALSSLFLNLELRFPFVFSYYGRQLVQLNYTSLTRTMAMLATPLDGSEPDEPSLVQHVALAKLQRAILSEFNTLNVMKECDMSYSRTRLCREYANKLVKDDPKMSIKSKAFRVAVFDASDCV